MTENDQAAGGLAGGPGVPAGERCGVTELLAEQCAHCRKLPDLDPFEEPAERPGRYFRARFPGTCAGCAETFDRGERIRYDDGGGFECEDCGDHR